MSVPIRLPSVKKSTLATPLASEALAVMLMVPDTVAPFAGERMLTAGGVVSPLLTLMVI